MALKWFKKKTAGDTGEKKKDDSAPSGKPDRLDQPIEQQPEPPVPEPPDQDATSIPPPAQAPEKQSAEQPDEAGAYEEGSSIEPPPLMDPAQPTPASEGKGLFGRLKKGLSKTRQILTTDIDDLFGTKTEIDEDFLEELEELLITSDIGVQTAMDLMQSVRRRAAKIGGPEALKDTLREEICELLKDVVPQALASTMPKPYVIMVVGVNGVGKTTTIGKLAARATAQGQSVLIAAADTFRAAAIEQLAIWAQRAKADLIKHQANSDPAAVVFDSIEAATARGSDVVFIDTAGRLHTKVNLMEELKKIKRIITKKIPEAPHEILLVLDATTGQNAISQAKLFHEALEVTGLALTKLDGTAKGGIVVSICQSLNIPLKHIGVGESVEDLQPFDPQQFVQALF